MDTYVEAGPENQSRLFAELNSQNKSKGGAFAGFTDNRLSAIAQRRQIDLMNAPAFPEEAGSTAPMGVSAIRGNVLQQCSGKGSALKGGACVQMKAFTAFAEADGLGLQNDPNDFFGGGYNHYQKELKEAANKGAAFEEIATLGGQVGAVADELLHKHVIKGNNQYYTMVDGIKTPVHHCWQPPGNLQNQWGHEIKMTKEIKNYIKINPFVVTANAKYLNAGLKKNLMTTSMYDHEHYSYVVKVEDDGNIEAMGNGDTVKGVMLEIFNNGNPPGYAGYAGQHGNNGNHKILTATNQEIEPYTKLAGEGARFMCVRNHINNIRDTTIFYMRKMIGNNGYYFGIRFNVLWNNWDHLFNQKFNITDDTIIEKLQNQQFNGVGNINIHRDYFLNHKAPKAGQNDQQVKLFV